MEKKDNIDLKSLWSKQTSNLPNADELILKANRVKKEALRKLIISNFLLIATAIFILWVTFKSQPQLILTKVGTLLVLSAILVYVFSTYKLMPMLNKINSTQTNAAFLQNLIDLKIKQQFLQTKMTSLYFALLSLGIGLYMYEYTAKMTYFWGIFSYILTFAWIGFNWFYTRPRTIKKQQEKLNEVINTFENINSQF